jgi:hypothetical protein
VPVHLYTGYLDLILFPSAFIDVKRMCAKSKKEGWQIIGATIKEHCTQDNWWGDEPIPPIHYFRPTVASGETTHDALGGSDEEQSSEECDNDDSVDGDVVVIKTDWRKKTANGLASGFGRRGDQPRVKIEEKLKEEIAPPPSSRPGKKKATVAQATVAKAATTTKATAAKNATATKDATAEMAKDSFASLPPRRGRSAAQKR